MTTASALRVKIEAALADRIPGALTPVIRAVRPVSPTGIESVDALLDGGLPVGAITELVGAESSGRTSLALAFVAQMTEAGKVCAWVDVSNTLHPESAAAIGVDLERLLWVRCGMGSDAVGEKDIETKSFAPKFALPEKYLVAPATIKGLHGGGCGPHPRGEIKGLPEAVGGFLRPEVTAPHCAEPPDRVPRSKEESVPDQSLTGHPISYAGDKAASVSNSVSKTVSRTLMTPHARPLARPLTRIDQALRVTDLLLQAGGFSTVILDMGSIAPEHALRVPMATWFRYRAAAERSQTSILLMTQHACAKSSAALLLNMRVNRALREESTVFTGTELSVEVNRERFIPSGNNVIPLRKPPVSERSAHWQSRTTWVGRA